MATIDPKEEQSAVDRESIFFDNLNIEPWKARYQHKRGELEKLCRGVYIDPNMAPLDRKALILKNAARIVKRAYPNCSLGGSSAYHRAAVEGSLLVSTNSSFDPVDIGGVFTIYNNRSDLDIGMNKEIEMVSIDDSFGTHSMRRWSDEIMILKNFGPSRYRPRNTYLNNIDLNRVVERAMDQHGGQLNLIDRLHALARLHEYTRYMKQIEIFVINAGTYRQEAKAISSFRVYWHKEPVATLQDDGHIWSFEYDDDIEVQLSVNEKKGRGSAPSFLLSILPEGQRRGTKMDEKMPYFHDGHRYISNITVQPIGKGKQNDIIVDIIDGELSKYTSGLLQFLGNPTASVRKSMADIEELDIAIQNPHQPRVSGMQMKLAANLSQNGTLDSANHKAFTHIIKTVGKDELYSSFCSMEWFSLTVAKGCGLNVENFAIADLGGRGPSLVVERFDLKKDLNDPRMILAEDFWSIAGHTDTQRKFHGELMEVADSLMKVSTNPKDDARHLLSQVIFSWLTNNSDLHLKNLLIVKEAPSAKSAFSSIRLSPMYDVLCTSVYGEFSETSAIRLGGTRHHTLDGFRALGKRMGVPAAETERMVESLCVSVIMWSKKVSKSLPEVIKSHEVSVRHINLAVEAFLKRVTNMMFEFDSSKSLLNENDGSFNAEEDHQDSTTFTLDSDDEDEVIKHISGDRLKSIEHEMGARESQGANGQLKKKGRHP